MSCFRHDWAERQGAAPWVPLELALRRVTVRVLDYERDFRALRYETGLSLRCLRSGNRLKAPKRFVKLIFF
jgi:hypothetical protein